MEGYILPVMGEAALLFILGAVLGSFIYVVALNYDNPAGWLKRSHSQCPHCNHTLRWFELIPLISYLFLVGQCRKCKKKISRRYFWVELLTGLAVTGLYLAHYTAYAWWQLAIAIAILIMWMLTLLYDARTMLLSDRLLWIILGITLLWRATFGGVELVSGLLGAVVAAAVLLVIRYLGSLAAKQEAMGAYDSLVGAVVGMAVGWPFVVIALFLSFVIGSVYGVAGALRRKVSVRGAEVPFAPALLVGGYCTWIWGSGIYSWYMGLII